MCYLHILRNYVWISTLLKFSSNSESHPFFNIFWWKYEYLKYCGIWSVQIVLFAVINEQTNLFAVYWGRGEVRRRQGRGGRGWVGELIFQSQSLFVCENKTVSSDKSCVGDITWILMEKTSTHFNRLSIDTMTVFINCLGSLTRNSALINLHPFQKLQESVWFSV